MSIIYDLIINVIDYLITFKYFNGFSGKRSMEKKYCVSLFCFCIILISVVNQFHNQNANLILCILMIYLYSLSFSYSISYHIILPVLYIGFGIVAELIGFLILNVSGEVIPYFISYYGSSFICEFIRFLIVYAICGIKKIKLPKLSFSTGKFLVIIPLSSLVICCMAINIIQNSKNDLVNIMCLVIIIMTITSNVLMFRMFFKVIDTLSDNYEKEMLLQEAEAKEQYYQEIEQSNREVRKISQAENLEIKTDVNIKVAKAVHLDYKDAGILLGNILDNAIEACEKIEKEDRWIKIDMFHKKNTLFIKVCNSKIKELVNINKSSKRDVYNHGIGVSSIKAIVKQYDGYVEFIDKGEEFEADVSLYGV